MKINVWNNRRKKNLGSQGRSDTFKGRVNKMIGKMQHKTGQLIGHRKLRARGTALQWKGSLQSGLGRAKQKIHNALSHVRS